MTRTVNLSNAKARLSGPVERAAAGEAIAVAGNGVPQARLVPLACRGQPRKPANAMPTTRVADDFDAPDAAVTRPFERCASWTR